VTSNLGGQGVFGVELFVKGDMVWFSEVSPRPHDTGMVTMATQNQSEFELHAKAILGLPVDVALRSPGASAVIYGQLEEAGIAFEGVAEALRVPGSDIRLFGKPESFARRRMGVALAAMKFDRRHRRQRPGRPLRRPAPGPDRKVAIISKRAWSLLDGASNWAQGGIAAVLDSGDSHDQHIADTLVAGAGLCDEAATRFIVEHGREAIEWLIEQGVPFTRDETRNSAST
jgi:hypothetical protein